MRFLLLVRAVPVLAVLVVAGCGGGHARAHPKPRPPMPSVREEGPFGLGADRYWLYRPARGAPRAVVIFLHGLDTSELTPRNHRPWLRQLAAEGDAVGYPRYE